MSAPNGLKNLSQSLGENAKNLISKLYIEEKKCPLEITNYLFDKTGIKITQRSIQRNIKKMGIARTKSEAFNLSIKTGRKDYTHLRKTVRSKDLRKGISLKNRYAVLKRDDFKCVLCGNSAKEDILMIDHVIPIVRGGNNDINNLRTLCRQCNLGKMIEEHEK